MSKFQIPRELLQDAVSVMVDGMVPPDSTQAILTVLVKYRDGSFVHGMYDCQDRTWMRPLQRVGPQGDPLGLSDRSTKSERVELTEGVCSCRSQHRVEHWELGLHTLNELKREKGEHHHHTCALWWNNKAQGDG